MRHHNLPGNVLVLGWGQRQGPWRAWLHWPSLSTCVPSVLPSLEPAHSIHLMIFALDRRAPSVSNVQWTKDQGGSGIKGLQGAIKVQWKSK